MLYVINVKLRYKRIGLKNILKEFMGGNIHPKVLHFWTAKTDRGTDEQMDRQTYKQKKRQTDGKTDRQTEGQTDSVLVVDLLTHPQPPQELLKILKKNHHRRD